MPCPSCCISAGIRTTQRAGTGEAVACVVGEDDDGLVYQTVVDTHSFSISGSYTVTTTVTGGPIVNGVGECSEISVVSTFDPEEDYLGDETITTSYSSEVTTASLIAAATVVYADPAEPAGTLHMLPVGPAWFSNDSGLPGSTSEVTAGGGEATVLAGQVKYDLEISDWLGCTLVIQWAKGSDDSDLSRTTINLTAVSPSSGWISAPTAAANDSVYAKWIAVRVAHYTTTAPPLPA